MDCALLEKLSANLIEHMLVTDDATELANYQRAYHRLQIKLSERKNLNIARQTILPTGRLEPKQRNSKRVHGNYQSLNKLAFRHLRHFGKLQGGSKARNGAVAKTFATL